MAKHALLLMCSSPANAEAACITEGKATDTTIRPSDRCLRVRVVGKWQAPTVYVMLVLCVLYPAASSQGKPLSNLCIVAGCNEL